MFRVFGGNPSYSRPLDCPLHVEQADDAQTAWENSRHCRFDDAVGIVDGNRGGLEGAGLRTSRITDGGQKREPTVRSFTHEQTLASPNKLAMVVDRAQSCQVKRKPGYLVLKGKK